MKAAYGLELVQTQKLSLTPEMRQALTVLQVSALELREIILQEVQENPLIEIEDRYSEETLSGEDDEEDEILSFLLDSAEAAGDLARDPADRRGREPESFLSGSRISLRDYLMAQVGVMPVTEAERKAIFAIIGSLDDNGYLRAQLGEISQISGQGPEVVERALRVVQSLEPAGVGARDLRECLLLQAKALGKTGLELRIIESHLEDLARGRYRRIAKEQGTTLEAVLLAKAAIMKLNPKPGASLACEPLSPVIPEVVIRKEGDRLTVELNDAAEPRIRWNRFYADVLRGGDREARSYLKDKLRRARNLVRCIEQRKMTLIRVMEAIVKRQRSFFFKGPGSLKPLTLREISEEVGLHESTVSRAIANKYVDTTYGIFPVRAFFSPRLRTSGASLSQESVKSKILEIVKTEDIRNPLGDREICLELEKLGMKVARRTVSKYRAELGIMPKNKRKSV
ncbi:MAG TPA: RNA polymerase factor sigma-54 [Firmicutes bacterium]|nr:RNA polymerase factor sigma-54 [Candidatus Fermentithermobacillaceae bacterium]